MTLMWRQGTISGTIRIGPHHYQLYDLGNGLHAVVEADPADVPTGGEASGTGGGERLPDTIGHDHDASFFGVGPAPTNPDPPDRAGTGDRCLPNRVNALVLYTPQVARRFLDIENRVALAVQETNEAYHNSSIPNYHLRVTHMQEFDFTESHVMNEDLDLIRSSSSAQQLRNQHDADIVVLMADTSAYQLGGIAYVTQNESGWNFPGSAYTIVRPQFAGGPGYVLAHEVGHIQGALHHPDDYATPPNHGFSYGFGHRFTVQYCPYWLCTSVPLATIMAYTPSGTSRVKHFSNPDILTGGVPTGVTSRDNARVLRETADNVADYRDPNPLRARIEWVSSHPSTGVVNLEADECGGNGETSYQWRQKEADATTWSAVLSTSPFYTALISVGYWMVELRVTTSTGQTSSTIMLLENDGTGGGICPPEQLCPGPADAHVMTQADDRLADATSEVSDRLGYTFGLAIYPNPSTGPTVVEYALENDGDVTVAVYDLMGRRVLLLDAGHRASGIHRVDLDGGLAAGTYIVHLRAGAREVTRSISLH